MPRLEKHNVISWWILLLIQRHRIIFPEIGSVRDLPKNRKHFHSFKTLCLIWYHLYNFKNKKHLWSSVTLVKLQTKACNFTKSNTLRWVYSRFLNYTNCTKLRKHLKCCLSWGEWHGGIARWSTPTLELLLFIDRPFLLCTYYVWCITFPVDCFLNEPERPPQYIGGPCWSNYKLMRKREIKIRLTSKSFLITKVLQIFFP